MTNILILDKSGCPKEWSPPEIAACYYAKDKVSWALGKLVKRFSGGVNAKTGKVSVIEVPSIIAVTGPIFGDSFYTEHIPSISRKTLFARDKYMCAYCGGVYHESMLSKEHIMPTSRGGKEDWNNLVTTCISCNHRKGNKTLAESGLELLYVPYTPNVFEDMILKNRKILDDQMEYLLSRVPKHSRLLAA